MIDGWSISCEFALIWMSLHFTDDQSTLVQVMAWCHQAASHYLSQCWPRSLSPYVVTRPQWVNVHVKTFHSSFQEDPNAQQWSRNWHVLKHIRNINVGILQRYGVFIKRYSLKMYIDVLVQIMISPIECRIGDNVVWLQPIDPWPWENWLSFLKHNLFSKTFIWLISYSLSTENTLRCIS